MHNREWGEYTASSEEIDREKRLQKRHDEQSHKEFLARQKKEEEDRLRPTEADKRRYEKEDRERAEREAYEAKFRPYTDSEQGEIDAQYEEIRRRDREREEYLRSPEAKAKLEAADRKRSAKEEERRRFEDKQAQEHYDALKEEKAPSAIVDSLMNEKLRLDVDEETSIDLQSAIPVLAERLRLFAKENNNDPDALRAADRIEENLKTVKRATEDALMFGGDYVNHLENMTDAIKQQIFVTSRKFEMDLVDVGKEAGEREAEDAGKEKLPELKDALEAALDDAGINRSGFDNLIEVLPEGGMISEKKMLQNTHTEIMQKLEQGVDPKKDEFLRATIDQFTLDLKRSMERNKIE